MGVQEGSGTGDGAEDEGDDAPLGVGSVPLPQPDDSNPTAW